MTRKKQKVVVALSGGVDSAVAGFLLKQKKEFEVTGVFMKLWEEKIEGKTIFGRCCTPEAEWRARRICDILNIPFYVIDCRREFKKAVVEYFLKEQKKGRTPNPCVVCNREIKFGVLLRKMIAAGFDLIATGHYARIVKRGKKYHLYRARDSFKDQSYFLWNLKEEQLKKILFPLGEITKRKVRQIAKRAKLPLKNIPESQELCFLSQSLKDFLSRHLKSSPGKIVTLEGQVLGKHAGLWFYTIGQRKGLFLSGGPWYVVKKDPEKNLLFVSRNPKDLQKKQTRVENVNWIQGKEPSFPLKVLCKIRYRAPFVASAVEKTLEKGKYLVVFSKPQTSPAPGQSAVFYKNDEVLGGGVIYE